MPAAPASGVPGCAQSGVNQGIVVYRPWRGKALVLAGVKGVAKWRKRGRGLIGLLVGVVQGNHDTAQCIQLRHRGLNFGEKVLSILLGNRFAAG